MVRENENHSVEMMVGDLILKLGKANHELHELKARVAHLESLLQKPHIKSSPNSTPNVERKMAQ
ncbi:hypothetical protein [Bacillus sp. SD088]|uniref:hypothetical protein n=1 Tax=Bacillus sp. SD088 TaxID=2782012 RepID=UPI001A963985|nr:hypothetical protein [Bacillus sp. SD088]MBO0991538.1 hypothetical protein [Bacillus sp. SD088]